MYSIFNFQTVTYSLLTLHGTRLLFGGEGGFNCSQALLSARVILVLVNNIDRTALAPAVKYLGASTDQS